MARATSRQEDWATSGVDLLLGIDRGAGVRASLERCLRDAIADGRLRAGTRLPSTRTLAADLRIARGTVLEAYMHLAAEGWIRGRRGSGTVVAAIGRAQPPPEESSAPVEERLRHDLRAGRPDPTSFPRTAWLRALRRALSIAPADALGLGDPRGLPELREQLAEYLARARGLRVRPQQIAVTTGFTQSLSLVARALAGRGGTTIAMEDPCLHHHRRIVTAAGLSIEPMPVDDDGACVEAVSDTPAAVLVTPNRQHPLGMPLAAARRAQLLEWARATSALVIEDDYDGEFRYDGAPIGALQGLEPGRVIYAGTTSKSLAPGVRLGWLVLPPDLLEPTLAQKETADWQTGALEQLALAELIRSGDYDRHIRKMRLRYRRRRDVLVDALQARFAAESIGGTAAGLDLHVLLPDVERERELLQAAAERGLALHGLASSGYAHGGEEAGRAGLIVGYAAPPEHAYAGAVQVLLEAVADRG
jgi:GntR family transcriptional regulator/MocR family aminotransferase